MRMEVPQDLKLRHHDREAGAEDRPKPVNPPTVP